MKLENRKKLVARTLNVGSSRIAFNSKRLSEVKEAITKQDVKDLQASGAISIKEKKGRKKLEKRNRRRQGSVKKKVKTKKADYANLTRKLRAHVKMLKTRNRISNEQARILRKEIRASTFKSLNNMKSRITQFSEDK